MEKRHTREDVRRARWDSAGGIVRADSGIAMRVGFHDGFGRPQWQGMRQDGRML